jgi:hypothetical protein
VAGDLDETREPYGLAAHLIALVIYVPLALAFKRVLLNGTTGPLFLLFALYLVPLAVRRLGRRR